MSIDRTMSIGVKFNEKVDRDRDRGEKRVKRKRRYMIMGQSPQVQMSRLQRLFMSCLDVFKGIDTIPSPLDSQKICQILDDMTLEDVGIMRGYRNFVGNDTTVIYKIICHSENFLLYLLLLPENAIIPLHDHPGMTVFSKLLFGEVTIKAFDMVNDPGVINQYPSPSPLMKLACLKEEGVLTEPCNARVLYPTTGGNIHEFKAIKPSIILDVAGPPFSKIKGRETYFNDVADAVLPDENMSNREECKRYRWLEKTILPNELL